MPTLHTLLKEHHTKHVYQCGRFKGDAPADSTNRRRTHFRIQKHDDTYCVRFHSTNIITAYLDGRIILDHNGWGDHNTTRAAFKRFGFGMRTHNGNGLRQTALFIQGVGWIRWDTLRLQLTQSSEAPYNYQIQGLVPCLQKFKIDTVALKAILAEPAVVEFQQVLPVLWAANSSTDSVFAVWPYNVHLMIRDSEKWPSLINMFRRDSPKETWQNIRRQLSAACRKIIPF